MKINISEVEMMLITSLISDFIHHKKDLQERITPNGVKKLKQVEIRMSKILIPEICLTKKYITELYKKAVHDFFTNGYQE